MKRNWSKKALSLLMAGTMMAGLAGWFRCSTE
jgi:hypothetical protein